LHEAVGHGLEGDFNRKGSSAFSGRIGQRVAAKGVTVLDDGTLADRRGSLNVDDEGQPSGCNVLIEDGILRGYIQDRMNARLMNVAPTGNGRRESYAHIPMPRMTNTYMLAGDKDPKEIIASIRKGLYATNFGGGQVDITSGKFVFSASEAYWVENGKILYPVKGATIVGSGPESLKKVSMIGNDMRLDSGVGTCGKEGPERPCGRGPAHPAHRRADGGRYGVGGGGTPPEALRAGGRSRRGGAALAREPWWGQRPLLGFGNDRTRRCCGHAPTRGWGHGRPVRLAGEGWTIGPCLPLAPCPCKRSRHLAISAVFCARAWRTRIRARCATAWVLWPR
jgi:hypothetical protein